ncbi:hypothetical protein HPB49_026572 [Dermacentor silvarum]|nr:hypothetical protein HPB49_026572 [Dermacentor silvarum]
MKLNISYPATGCQKLIEVDDEKKVRIFYEKRMGQEVEADALGDEWKGYVVRISGGNDKQGFPMKQGVLTAGRVRLLLSKATHATDHGVLASASATPKIQRLITPAMLQHKRRRVALKKRRTQKRKEEAADYARLLAQRAKEAKEKRQDKIRRRRSASHSQSQSSTHVK